LDLGMNNWMSEAFQYPTQSWDRGKVLDDAALAKVAKFERYRDVDGDGIPYRTLPGSKDWKGTYFTRGSGHDEAARYTEDPNAYVRNMDRLKRKLETARTLMPQPELSATNGADVGLIACGSSHWAVLEARAELAAQGLATSYLRVRGLPLPASVAEFVRQHDRIYVIEQNRDGQLAERIRSEAPERATRVKSVLHYDGLPLDARGVSVGVMAHEGLAQGVTKGAPPHRPGNPSTASGCRRRNTTAARRRCVRAAATMRSPAASSRRRGRPGSSRTASPSSRASAARARPRPTSSATRTASTPCTAACPASPPACMPRTASWC